MGNPENLMNLPYMYQRFFLQLKEVAAFTEEDLAQIRTYLKPKKLRRRQYLLQEGEICRNIAFVEKGALRSYSVDDRGSEHIIQFALEGWLISDLFSFLTDEPSPYNIEAIEDCELVLISKAAHEELLKKIPRYQTYIRIQITGAYISMQRRLNAIISQSLEERYEGFAAHYPEIFQRVPQHMIASYMGLSPETLSRVRKRLATR